ncbi:uncharacterized protein JCM15063_005537 [Sporobolomyces koalae]|uniref:uncharacterized protein n=1 Tax=Sporobolomyces koalae TaxID=500713 RepID=UPI00317270CD
MASDLAYRFNPNVHESAAPPIPLAAQWATEYTATADEPLLNLAQGVPGDPPPEELLDKLAAAARDPTTTGYGDLRGELGLRRELANDIERTYQDETTLAEWRVTTDNVTITAGCNIAFYASIITLCRAGDQVILPTPWYFNHEMVLRQLGISLVPLPCEAPSFLPSVSRARALITSKTKAIVLVSPNNPTGAVYTRELLNEVATLAIDKGVALILDETYRDFVTGRPHDLFIDTPWRTYLVHLFSFSKSYAIPGHRLGAIVAAPAFHTELGKTLDCLQICPARPAQRALEWAISGTREWRNRTKLELGRRQQTFKELLEQVEGWSVETGSGYFAYVKHPFAGTASQVVAQKLAAQVGVVALPGTFFSPPFSDVNEDRYIRFSIANVSLKTLRLVPERLEKLNRLWQST